MAQFKYLYDLEDYKRITDREWDFDKRGKESRSSARLKQPISESLRWQVWERDNFTCKKCGSRRRLEVDHIIPESRGGKAEIDNVQTLCKSCNCRKGNRQ